jgi:penicillin amidase
MRRTLAIVALLIALASFFFLHRGGSEGGTWVVRGLNRPARIIRDQYGIPHIFAEDRRDLAFALGYTEGGDRLWQLDVNRHIVRGTLSEFLGAKAIPSDLFLRTVGLEKAAQRALEGTSPETRVEIEAFAAGVNAFVAQHPGSEPLEYFLTGHSFEPFAPADCAGTATLLAWQLSLNLKDEILALKLARRIDPSLLDELFPEAPEVALPAEAVGPRESTSRGGAGMPGVPPEVLARLGESINAPSLWLSGGLAASNNWVVGGERTSSGKPILANDPHLPLGLPSIWYEAHLVAPGIDVVGAAIPGLPYVIIGHNRRIAFGFTNVMADNQDLYIEKVNPANPRQALFEDQWEDMRAETISIPVKGAPSVEKVILYTRHGPLLSAVEPGLSETVALKWTGHGPIGDLDGFRMLDEAGNWDEARAAARRLSASQNLVYADVDGGIGWQVTGTIPIRAKGDGRFPLPGWTGDHEWKGAIPFDALPSYYLPSGGAPQITGSRVVGPVTHFLATANERTVHSDYPYWISNSWAAPYRFLRIRQLLGTSERLSVQDVERVQADQHPLLADTLLALLSEVFPDTRDLGLALATLKAWDGQARRNSSGATLYELTLLHLMRNAYGDDLGDLYPEYASRFGAYYTGMDALIHEPDSPWWDDTSTPIRETRRDMLRKSLLEAVRDARERLGDDPAAWRWGDLHHAVFGHVLGKRWPLDLLFNRSIPYGGDANTVNNGAYDLDQPFDVTWASSYRLVVDLSDVDHAQAMNSTGESGRTFTAHSTDMMKAWADVRYHTLWTNEGEIRAHQEGTLLLRPEP